MSTVQSIINRHTFKLPQNIYDDNDQEVMKPLTTSSTFATGKTRKRMVSKRLAPKDSPHSYKEYEEAKVSKPNVPMEIEASKAVLKGDVPAGENAISDGPLLLDQESGTEKEVCRTSIVVQGQTSLGRTMTVYSPFSKCQGHSTKLITMTALSGFVLWLKDISEVEGKNPEERWFPSTL